MLSDLDFHLKKAEQIGARFSSLADLSPLGAITPNIDLLISSLRDSRTELDRVMSFRGRDSSKDPFFKVAGNLRKIGAANSARTYVIRYLFAYVSATFGAPHYNLIATIVNVAFDSDQVDDSLVRKLTVDLRRGRSRAKIS